MRLTDKLKIGIVTFLTIALGCAALKENSKLEYPSLENKAYGEYVDYDQDGFPEMYIAGYYTKKDSMVNVVVGYRVVRIVREGSKIIGYERKKHPIAINRYDETGGLYLKQYDDNEDGIIDRYKHASSEIAIEKK